MEKETKRGFQNILEILREQQATIRELEHKTMLSTRASNDSSSKRIERVAQEISEPDAFKIDWTRLCDRYYAKGS
jgi:uncharacterized protein with von Willebrand factor type A (vWA) domain